MLVCPPWKVSLWNNSLTCQEEEYSKSNIQISSISPHLVVMKRSIKWVLPKNSWGYSYKMVKTSMSWKFLSYYYQQLFYGYNIIVHK